MSEESPTQPHEHHFEMLSSGYFKETGGENLWGMKVYDQSISYAMLYCAKCGKTIEVVDRDHRKQEEVA